MATSWSRMIKRAVGGDWKAIKQKYGLYTYSGNLNGVTVHIDQQHYIPSLEPGYITTIWRVTRGAETIGAGLCPVDAALSAKYHLELSA